MPPTATISCESGWLRWSIAPWRKLGGTTTGNVGAPASPTSTLTTCRTARCFTAGGGGAWTTAGGSSGRGGGGVGGRAGVDIGAVCAARTWADGRRVGRASVRSATTDCSERLARTSAALAERRGDRRTRMRTSPSGPTTRRPLAARYTHHDTHASLHTAAMNILHLNVQWQLHLRRNITLIVAHISRHKLDDEHLIRAQTHAGHSIAWIVFAPCDPATLTFDRLI